MAFFPSRKTPLPALSFLADQSLPFPRSNHTRPDYLPCTRTLPTRNIPLIIDTHSVTDQARRNCRSDRTQQRPNQTSFLSHLPRIQPSSQLPISKFRALATPHPSEPPDHGGSSFASNISRAIILWPTAPGRSAEGPMQSAIAVLARGRYHQSR